MKRRSRVVALVILALACLWSWRRYAPMFEAPRSRLPLDAFYPRMPPDASHIYLRLPIDHADAGRGWFKGFYILSPGFKKGGPVVFFLSDGQQPNIKPWLTAQDFKEDFDPWMGGLSYVVVGGRGMEPAYFPELYDASGRLNIPEAMRLYGSVQYVDDIEAVRRDMASRGLLPRDGKIMLFGRSGAGVLAQQYLGKYGAHVSRVWLMSTGAPDLSAREGRPFNRSLEDFNPAAVALFDAALSRNFVDRPCLAWMLQRLGYLSADGRRRQVELLEQIGRGERSAYWRGLLNPSLNHRFMAAMMRSMTEMDLSKVRIFELLGWDLVKPRTGSGGTTDLMAEAFGAILEDFITAARTGRIPARMPDVDRASFSGEVLVLSGSRDNVFSPDMGRKIARSYRNSRWILVDDGHRMVDHRPFCFRLARTFFTEGLGAAAMKGISAGAR